MLDNERNLDLREWMLNQKEEEEEEREGLKEEQERKEKREDGRVAATGEEIRQEIVNRHLSRIQSHEKLVLISKTSRGIYFSMEGVLGHSVV